MVSPDGQNLDNFYLARPGADEVQLDLFGDYKSNVALYPAFQEYFRNHKPPLLAAWGKNDPFFVPAGAEAFKRDNPRFPLIYYVLGRIVIHYNYLTGSQPANLKGRPGERRDPYAVPYEKGTAVAASLHHERLWLWVPAFAGTTRGYST